MYIWLILGIIALCGIANIYLLPRQSPAVRTAWSLFWTLACAASQFQQQVRLMCGLPPADTRLLSPCTMANILGDLWGGNGGEPHWEAVQQHPSAHLHLYGKTAARNGRKMGHFTVLADTADQAYAAAQQLHAQLDNTE